MFYEQAWSSDGEEESEISILQREYKNLERELQLEKIRSERMMDACMIAMQLRLEKLKKPSAEVLEKSTQTELPQQSTRCTEIANVELPEPVAAVDQWHSADEFVPIESQRDPRPRTALSRHLRRIRYIARRIIFCGCV